MFTRNIKNIVQLGKSGVRWDASSLASSSQADPGLKSLQNELKWLKESSQGLQTGQYFDKGMVLRSLDRVRDAMKKISARNEVQKGAIQDAITVALSSDSVLSPETKKEIEKLKIDFDNDFKKVEIAKDIKTVETIADSRKGQERLRSTVIDTKAQTTALKKILDGENTPGVKALLAAMTEKEEIRGEANTKTTDVKLEDTTVGSVVLTLLALHKVNAGKEITVDDFKKSYISNGAYWNGDSQAIYNLLKVFNNTTNRTDIVTAFQKLAPTYQALGTTVEYEKNTVTLNNLTLQNLIATLASLPRFEGDSDKAKNTDSLKKLLESIPEANRVARIKGIIALGGGLVEATDLDGVISAMKASPSLLSQYHAGMNLLGLKGSLGGYLRTGKYDLAPDTEVLTQQMNEMVDAAREKGVKKVKESPMSKEEKTKALAEIDKRYQIAKSPENIRTYGYHATALLTNEGLGLAGGITTEMRSIISDSISAGLFAGIGDGKFDLGASLLATKNLHASQNATFDLFYGLSASKEGVLPVAGFKGSYGEFLYSFYGNKLGGGAFLGTRMGTNQHSAEDLRAIAETPAAVKSMIDAGIKNRNDFKIDTGNPESNMWINTRIQQLLTAGNYDSLPADSDQKPIALHSVLIDAVRERANMVKEMMKNNGGGLSVIGLNLGKFAGLTYVIPGFSWSKVETFHMTKVTEGATIEAKTSKTAYKILNRDKPDTVILDTALPADAIIPELSNLSSDRKTLTGLDSKKNIVLEKNAAGKIELKYTTPVANLSQPTQSAELTKTVEMKEVISDTQIRSAISYFAAVGDRVKIGETLSFLDKNLNIATSKLDRNKDWIATTLKPMVVSLLTMKVSDSKYGSQLKKLATSLQKETDPNNILNQVRLIRDALMTDRLQASVIGKTRKTKNGEQSNLQYYGDMLERKGLESALTTTGFSKSDFIGIMPLNAGDIGYTPRPRPNMIGAVATWKFPPAHMAYLPAGAVWMSSEPKETNKKAEALKTLGEVAHGSILTTELAKVKEKLKTPFRRELTDLEMKDLLLGKEVKSGTKTLKLDAKFYTFCYGACMNPSVGFEIGNYTITEPDSPTATGTATIETTVPGTSSLDMTFASGSVTDTFSLGAGGVSSGNTTQKDATTNPGDRPGDAGGSTGGSTGGGRPGGIPTPQAVAEFGGNVAAGLAQAASSTTY